MRTPTKESDEITIEEIVIDSIVDKIAGGEAAYDNTAGERVDEEADESTIEEIVIDSIVDKIAGGEAADDKTAGESVAIHDKIAEEEAADDNTIDPFIELVVLAADRVDEKADEITIEEIVINSIRGV